MSSEQYRISKEKEWKLIRASAAEDSLGASGALLAATDMVAGALERNLQVGVVDLFELFEKPIESLILAFFSDDSGHAPVDADKFSYTVIGWASDSNNGVGNPPLWIAQSVAVGDCLCGLMTLAAEPISGGAISSGARWVQTLTRATNVWNGDVTVNDGGSADRIATLKINNLLDVRYMKVFIHGCAGTGTVGEAPAITVIGRIIQNGLG